VGCEVAEAFASLWGADVTLVEAAPTPLPEILDAELGAVVVKHLEDQGVKVVTSSPVERFEADDEGVTVHTGDAAIRADVAVVAVGVRPRVELAAAAGISLGPTGAIRVD
jgi:pyruvate/2-oxoglutarate dehydrogenase complex dihydrolipoamide dehydrogenase (E3) component